jgi:hypothetical protein
MLQCSIKGCKEIVSEIINPEVAKDWFVARAEDVQKAKMDVLSDAAETDAVRGFKERVWPNLDWWILGGVERVVLCPKHKIEVAGEVLKLRILDPTTNPEKPDPSNRSGSRN